MTAPTPLAETIARVERENARLPVGSCPVSQADLTALLSCARRCEAMARVGERLADLRLMADSGMSIIPGSTVLDLIDLYEDAASERDALSQQLSQMVDYKEASFELTAERDALAKRVGELEQIIDKAQETAVRFGGIDGGHHKTWVIDQMVRTLAGDKYDALVAEACDGEDGPNTYEWEVGIAP